MSRVTLKFDGWPKKNNRAHLSCAASSFVHHFIAIGEFKLELQSGNAQFGSKSTIFFSRVTLKFDGWPWTTIGHIFYTTVNFVHHFKAMSEFELGLHFGNAQFVSKSAILCPMRPWNLTNDLEKQCGTSSKQQQALCIISLPYMNSNWCYGPETAKWGHDFCDLDLWPQTLTCCMNIISVNGNISWKFQDDTMARILSKRCDGRTDGQTLKKYS